MPHVIRKDGICSANCERPAVGVFCEWHREIYAQRTLERIRKAKGRAPCCRCGAALPFDEPRWTSRLCDVCRATPRPKSGKPQPYRYVPPERFCQRCNVPLGRKNKWCASCVKERQHRTIVARVFKMPPGDYDRFLELQGGKCAICLKPPKGRRLAVDHDHSTGSVRGLLCSSCNYAIGAFADSPDVLTRAIAYLVVTPATRIAGPGAKEPS